MKAQHNRGGVRLRDIRVHEGSQARAWEELAYQLRPDVAEGHLETRKTRAPDAGVEWYELYADGHQEGFQAKFHECLADALGGMRESVEAVCTKRPSLTKLTFVVPYDFTDSGSGPMKSDQDRWNDAVASWRTSIPAASSIDFSTIRAGDITATLTLKEHAGRREYWFGGIDLSDEWLLARFGESISVAGDRYTPEADTASSINDVLDAVVASPAFLTRLRALSNTAVEALTKDAGIWGQSSFLAEPLIPRLHEACAALSDNADNDGDSSPYAEFDLSDLAHLTTDLLGLAYHESEFLRGSGLRNMDAAIAALQGLEAVVTGSAAEALANRALALVGPAGQGKTHALLRAVDGCLQRGTPAIAILGQRLSDKNWWPAAAKSLGISSTSDEFLQALDSMAEARYCRALLVFDAINESQNPGMWHHELPAMLAQVQRFPHIALVVSYRTDYRDVIGAPKGLLTVRHTGLAGSEAEALAAYCRLFKVPVPSSRRYDPAFRSPLFLRMYCEVLAAESDGDVEVPTRSGLFDRFARVIGKKVTGRLGLSPTSHVVSDAMDRVADLILSNKGQPVPRDSTEQGVDELLPGRLWPNTLFQQLASEGLVELRPTYDGTEAVGFPFQAYSEHILASRLIATLDDLGLQGGRPLPSEAGTNSLLVDRVAQEPWSWRSLAVILPELGGIELVDILPEAAHDYRLQEAFLESLIDRVPAAFGGRALEALRDRLLAADDEIADVVLALAARTGHPANADWLHAQLSELSMPDRDAAWSISTYGLDKDSDAFSGLIGWAQLDSDTADDDEVRLAATAFMWLFTSPNRFLRDTTSKALISLLSHRLHLAAALIGSARQVDDAYVQERMLTCAYGAVLVGGDSDLVGAGAVLETLKSWFRDGAPVDVLARDSSRGIAAWCVDRGLLPRDRLADFEPPYDANPPTEPPTREQLESTHGPVKDGEGKYKSWRAGSILHSCLDWYGDFNKYVVKSDVGFFSWHPLTGPPPKGRDRKNPLDRVNADWAGRWIAARSIELGWSAERFEDFERSNDLRRGREGHKAERFGKKYQWIAHRELLGRLADNFHPSHEPWTAERNVYEGPWEWFGRDFDPTLPPSVRIGGSQVCRVARDSNAKWATLTAPDMDVSCAPDEWAAKTDDLPAAKSMFSCTDAKGEKWIAIQRYSTWDRDNSQRRGMSKREKDVFFLQFSWLLPRGRGKELFDFIAARGLSGRWMPDVSRPRQQYLGETGWAPVSATAGPWSDYHGIPEELIEAGALPRPAVEQYLWEGSTLDCSIDESVNFYTPTSELLGTAKWVGHQPEWTADGRVVARAIEFPEHGETQGVLLVDPGWLSERLSDLDSDLVIGTLSERHALPIDDDDYRNMAYSDIWYVAMASSHADITELGPFLRVRRTVDEGAEPSDPSDISVPDEPFDVEGV